MGATGMATVRVRRRRLPRRRPAGRQGRRGVVRRHRRRRPGADHRPREGAAARSTASMSEGETALYAGIQDAVRRTGYQGRAQHRPAQRRWRHLPRQGRRGRAASEKRRPRRPQAGQGPGRGRGVQEPPRATAASSASFAKADGGSVVPRQPTAAACSAPSTAAARALDVPGRFSSRSCPRGAGRHTGRGGDGDGGRPGRSTHLARSTSATAAPAVAPTEAPALAALPPIGAPGRSAAVPGRALPASIAGPGARPGLPRHRIIGVAPSPRSKQARAARLDRGVRSSAARRHRPRARPRPPTAISAQLVEHRRQGDGGPRLDQPNDGAHRRGPTCRARAGEWFVLRIVAVVVAAVGGFVLFGSHQVVGVVLGVVVGLILPPVSSCATWPSAGPRSSRPQLPDVLMLVATASLAAGFSLLQALDAVAKDAAEPAAKEFSRALAETRIGADITDALEQHGRRGWTASNMRWTAMAIRIQREVGGNLAETCAPRPRRCASARCSSGRCRRCRPRASSRPTSSSPSDRRLALQMKTNYEYISAALDRPLWASSCRSAGLISLGIGICWMRKVVM